MADGAFPGLVSKDRNVNAVANPIFVELSDGSAAIGVTSGAIDVNVANSTIAVTQSGTWDIGTVTTLTGITNDVNIADGGNSITVDGTVAATQSGTWDIGTVTTLTGITNDVNIADGGNSITVDGTVAATQSGTWNIGTVASITADVNIADGGNSITVDAADLDIRDLTHVSDSVKVGDGTDLLAVNTDGSINVNVLATGAITGEVHDYDTASAVASDGTDNHDYTVVNSTFLLSSVIVSGSGNVKAEIQVGPVASLVTKAVVFLNGRQGDTKQVDFNPPIEVPVASTGTVRVIRTNRQGAATDVYSTIIGRDV